MSQLAVIDLCVPGTEKSGRVFLERSLLSQTSVQQLEEQLGREFDDPDDLARMTRIGAVLRGGGTVILSVYPGEEAPLSYFAYVKDPQDDDAELLACVLAPPAVVQLMINEGQSAVFETAGFQVMPADTTLSNMQAALEAWVGRVWPELTAPRLDVRPWPIEAA